MIWEIIVNSIPKENVKFWVKEVKFDLSTEKKAFQYFNFSL